MSVVDSVERYGVYVFKYDMLLYQFLMILNFVAKLAKNVVIYE